MYNNKQLRNRRFENVSKLVDIKGYWNMSIGYSFNDNGMWEGKLLLEDDGWFEGIVNDLTSPYTGDRMIFGIYHPTKIIELFKVSPANVSDPFVFRGQRTTIGYEGYFSVLGDYEDFGKVQYLQEPGVRIGEHCGEA